MLLSYLKLSLRLLIRNPLFSVINIAGLAIGFAAFIVLWQYSSSELNSDRQWKDWQRIARVGFWWEWTDDGKSWEGYFNGHNSTGFPSLIKNDYAQIESFTRIIHQVHFDEAFVGLPDQLVVAYEQEDHSRIAFKESRAVCADANLFEFFSIPLIHGQPGSCLNHAKAIVLSESSAIKYFGNNNPVGKQLQVNGISYEVTGVFQDLPRNSHLVFDMVFSNASRVDYWAIDRPMPNADGYIKSKSILSWKGFESELNRPEAIARYWAKALEQYPNGRGKFFLQPLEEVAFAQVNQNRFVAKSVTLLIVFQLLGWTILLIAAINFINLNTSRVMNRLREIATRKISGAAAPHFASQFMVETTIIFLLSIGLALTLIQLTKPSLQELLNIHLASAGSYEVVVIVISSLILIVLSSAYPAYMAFVHHPRALFNRQSTFASRGTSFLTLTTFQYVAAIILIIWGFGIYRQITFVLSKELGFDKERVVVVEAPVTKTARFKTQWETFQQRVSAQRGIAGLASCTNIMGESIELVTMKRPGIEIPLVVDTNGGIDHRFIPFFNLQLIAGRNFLPDDRHDVIIISEGAASRLTFDNAAEAVGSKVRVLTKQVLDGTEENWADCEIIGVVKGYRLRPALKFETDADKMDRGITLINQDFLISSLTPERLIVRLDSYDFNGVLAGVQSEFDDIFPDNVFTWYPLDENITRQYQTEKLWRNQILFFTGLAIVLACLGLAGMVANRIARKTKEVGIRKVLGAKLYQIGYLLVHSTFHQVMIASVVGIPVAYYLINQYLERFTERLPLQWWHFVVPVVILIVIMLLSIASMLWKAAHNNPVEALKHE
ncbi:MAG: ABC transporter permease [Cyclobacteriaceae bacterium]